MGSGRVQKVKVNWLAFQSHTRSDTNKQTNTFDPPHPKRPNLYLCLWFRVIDQVTRDVLPLNDFPLSPIGEELFPENLGHAHKTNAYVDAWRP